MASGVVCDCDVKEKYQKVKTGKKNPYIIFKLTDDLKKICVDQVGDEGETFENFREKMMEAAGGGQGRYAVYDLTEDQEEGKNKTGVLVFIVWISDDNCGIKQKMLYTSSKNTIRQACEGCFKEVQINDPADFNIEYIRESIKK